ncbi:hypothetical protein MC7420_80 [Coleofasciculus chthonoplastes PCC 7420]|uniref:Uncharacterized protein n=1 Tax=Coleofasciculus chthonoplastes PCC 7420 TaxID=118168 RepID=B4W2U4_9CYAN|nr:hypothetical protein MC7420_80 [Coleofasciculus chthonoplastes PCC 7420]
MGFDFAQPTSIPVSGRGGFCCSFIGREGGFCCSVSGD